MVKNDKKKRKSKQILIEPSLVTILTSLHKPNSVMIECKISSSAKSVKCHTIHHISSYGHYNTSAAFKAEGKKSTRKLKD